MSNVYFDWPAKVSGDRFVRFTTVRADDVNAAFDEVSAGFEKIPSPVAFWQGTYNFGVAAGAVNAWTASIAPTRITALTDGLTVRVRFTATNTSITPTLNLNGLGAKTICRDSGLNVSVGDIVNGMVGLLTYSATFGKWQLTATSANYDDFNDRYLGAKAADPTVNNDGGPLETGMIYWNYTTGRLRVYGNSQWNELVNGSVAAELFSGNGATVTFTLSAAPPTKEATQVYVNGVYQNKATYTLVGTSLTLSEAPPLGSDNVEVVVVSVLPIGSTTAGLITYDNDGSTGETVFDTVKPMASYTVLRAYTGRASTVRITADGVAGFFKRDAADVTSADNGGTIIVDASGRRWKRQMEGQDVIDTWFGVTSTGDQTANLAAMLSYCIENDRRIVLTQTAYAVSGAILPWSSRAGVRRLAVHARVPCTITYDAAAAGIDFFMYLATTQENFVDWSGGLVTFNGNSKVGSFLRVDNNGADDTGDVVFERTPFLKNLKKTAVDTGENGGITLVGPYRRIWAVQPQADTIERTAAGGATSAFAASGFTGECVVFEPIISRVKVPNAATDTDADGIKLFGKAIGGVLTNKRAGKAVVYGGVFTDCQGRNVKFQCSEGTVIRPLSIRQALVSIAQSVDYDFQCGNGMLDAPKYIYKKNGGTSPLGTSHSPVTFAQLVEDEDMVATCRDAELISEVAMERFCTVTHSTNARASITRITGLRAIPFNGFATQMFTQGIMQTRMDTIEAKSYETTLEVSDCKGPFGSYCISYSNYGGASVAAKLNIVCKDNVNTVTTSMYRPWYNASGSPVRVPKSLLLRNNSGWRSFYGDLDLTINTMVPGCVVTTNLSTCTVTGKPATWTTGIVTWECSDHYFSATDKQVTGRRLSGTQTSAMAYTYDGGTNWSYVGGGRLELEGSATYHPPSLAAGAIQTTTVTVTGAEQGDIVTGVSFPTGNTDAQWWGIVSAADTVTVMMRNNGAGALDLGSATLRVRVQKMV